MHSESTSAFCQARAALPLDVLTGALRHTAQQIQHAAGESALWLGHHVALLDGTTLRLYPSADLVDHYGQHANQWGTTYWVVMRVTAAFCLLTGSVLGVAEGFLHLSEQVLVRTVLAHLHADSVCVGDQNFGVFSVVQAARHHALFVLLRLTAARARALTTCPLHAGRDSPVVWAPSADDHYDATMSTVPIAGRLLSVRVQRDGFHPVDLYIFTTLLDETRYTLDELVKLYSQRWHVELDLRYVKDTLDMGLLSAKSVDTVRKELYAGLLAYNIIRAWMRQAAQGAGLTPLALSFTQCWRRVRDTLLSWRPADTRHSIRREIQRLLARLATCLLQDRLRFRIEPRAVRKRPAPYPPLKGSRAAARQRTREQSWAPVKS
jgi:Transposase DDE domain